MEIDMLGTLEVRDALGRPVPVTSAKQRVVLAALALQVRQVVPVEHLIDCLWGEEPPPSAHSTVHSHVLRLRRSLAGAGSEALLTRAPGYLLDVEPDRVDLHRAEALRARAAAAGDDPGLVAGLLREALALWRGPLLADVDSALLRERHATAWAEVRLQTVAARVEADLALGRHAELLGELRSLVAEHPLREDFRGQLMGALRASGLRAEALREFHKARQVLVDELGIEPGEGLRELYREILGPAVAAPVVPAPAVPAELPHSARGFAGRRAELARLDDLLARPADAEAVTVALLDGMGGVGKTATALRWAHRHARRFPDGQLYLDLRGFGPAGEPVPADEALARLLRSLGEPAGSLPDDLDGRAARLRSLLARRRVLLVLDNARTADQVRPLLPGSPGCFVVVTSRVRLDGLVVRDGAVPVPLGPLAEGEALDLFAGHLGADRVAGERAAAVALAEYCAYLPLTLSLVAARVLQIPGAGLAEVLGELRGRPRLDAFGGPGDEDTNLRVVLSWSYRALPAGAAALFAALARHPGPTLGVPAAAALAGVPAARAAALLAELVRAHMVEETVPGRFRLHDLLHAYAAELPAGPGAELERRRVLDWYLHTAAAADQRLRPHRTPVEREPVAAGVLPLGFEDYHDALDWCRGEHANLTAAVAGAAAHGLHGHAWRLALVLWSYHYVAKQRRDWLAASEIGVASARAAGDPQAEGAVLACLGTALCESERYPEAIERYGMALELHRQTGDRVREPATLNSLAVAYAETGGFEQALVTFGRARDVHAQLGNLQGEAMALANMALCHANLGQHDEAIVKYDGALVAYRKLGDRYGEAISLANVGELHATTGAHERAVAVFEEAIAVHDDAGNAHGRARTCLALGKSLAALGRYGEAARSWREALEIFEALDDPQAAETRTLLASAH